MSGSDLEKAAKEIGKDTEILRIIREKLDLFCPGETESSKDKKDEEREFEEGRRSLLNTYNSEIQTHAGLVIAITIGGLELVSNSRSFIVGGWWFIGTLLSVLGLLGVTVFGFFYVFSRIFYYTMYANYAITLSLNEVKRYFVEYNEKHPFSFGVGKAPYMYMLQLTIKGTIFNIKNGKIPQAKLGLLQRAALRFSREKDPN